MEDTGSPPPIPPVQQGPKKKEHRKKHKRTKQKGAKGESPPVLSNPSSPPPCVDNIPEKPPQRNQGTNEVSPAVERGDAENASAQKLPAGDKHEAKEQQRNTQAHPRSVKAMTPDLHRLKHDNEAAAYNGEEISPDTQQSFHPSTWYFGFGTFLLVAVTSIVVFLYLGFSGSEKHSAGPCNSSECSEAFLLMKAVMNEGIDPCHNFYGHVCYGWKTGSDIPTIFNYTMEMLYRKISFQFRQTKFAPDRYGIHILQTLHVECHKFMRERGRPLKELLDVFEDERKILNMANYSEVLTNLFWFSLSRGLNSVFQLGAVKWHKKTYLHVATGKTILQKLREKEFHGHVKQFLTDTIQQLDSKSAQPLYETVASIDTKLTALNVDDDTPEERNVTDATDLSEHLPLEFWVAALEKLSERLPLSPTILTTSFNNTRYICQSLEGHPTNSRLIYVYLLLVMEALSFEYWRRGRSQFARDINTVCLHMPVLPRTLPYLIGKVSGVSSLIHQVHELYKSILNTMSDAKYFPWMDGHTWNNARARLRNLPLLTFPGPSSDNVPPEIDYTKLTNLSGGFMKSYVDVVAFDKAVQTEFPPDLALRLINQVQFDNEVRYLEMLRLVVMANTLNVPPMMYSNAIPTEFNFGTVGVLLAKVLVGIMSPTFSEAHSNQVAAQWWSQWSRRSFAVTYGCFYKLFGNRTALKHSASLLREIFTWTLGLRVAHDAMEKTISNITKVQHWWDVQQMFFRRFCLLSCGHKNGDALSEMDAKMQCTLPIVSMPAFAWAFQCDPGATMNPYQRCATF
ncbi:uncharacterized protein LOC135399200 isoform X2 [Ornithodoros turicata]|uniref:uncharacterized protein LOC135399200 isoform X2 n=1 Tax=Ornithodoros turicata TaxID=34597 RepID=UPI003138C1CC